MVGPATKTEWLVCVAGVRKGKGKGKRREKALKKPQGKAKEPGGPEEPT